jgi:hypothetical protein
MWSVSTIKRGLRRILERIQAASNLSFGHSKNLHPISQLTIKMFSLTSCCMCEGIQSFTLIRIFITLKQGVTEKP